SLLLVGAPRALRSFPTRRSSDLTLLASVTLLPALLGAFGRNLDRLRIGRRRPPHGAASGSARAVVRFRWAAIVFAVGAFVLLGLDRKSTRLNSSHVKISYAVFCL